MSLPAAPRLLRRGAAAGKPVTGVRDVFSAFCGAAIDTNALFTVMTAAGLIATVVVASASMPTGAIVACVLIAVLGSIVAGRQFARAYAEAVEAERLFQVAKVHFEDCSEEWKSALNDLLDRGSVKQTDVKDETGFRHCGFVYLDAPVGRFYLIPSFAKSVKRLAKEWKASRLHANRPPCT